MVSVRSAPVVVNLGCRSRLLLLLNTLEMSSGLVPRPLLKWEVVIYPAYSLRRKMLFSTCFSCKYIF